MNMKDYYFEKTLGSGSFSTVWKCKHKETNKIVAIKIIEKTNLVEDQKILREIEILKKLNHPFILSIYDYFEDNDNFFLVQEFLEGGNLVDYLKKYSYFEENLACKLFSQIISALDYLHNHKFIIHRDLKCENLLLDENYNIRIIDFGFSNIFTEQNPFFNTSCGSPAYTPPELIKGELYSKNADIWSLGIVLFTMVAGKLPFDHPSLNNLLKSIIYNEVIYPNNFSLNLVSLLDLMLCKNQNERISIQDIINQKWIKIFNYYEFYNIFCNNYLNDNKFIYKSKSMEIKTDYTLNEKILFKENLKILITEIIPEFKDHSKLFLIPKRRNSDTSTLNLLNKKIKNKIIIHKFGNLKVPIFQPKSLVI